MPRVLTKRKQKWVNQFRPDVVQGLPLSPNAGVELRYQRQLDRLIQQMTAETEKELKRLFKGSAAEKYFAEDESIASQAKRLTNKLMKKFDELFARAAEPVASQFAASSDAASSTAVHESLKQLSGGLSLPTSAITAPMKEILKATVTENVALIKSIPQQYLNGVQQAVMRSITSGNGLQDLVPYLQKHKGITERRARFIANDQTRKAFNNLSRGRVEKLGIEKGKWLHTGGSHEPRKTHKEMSGEIFVLAEGMYDSAVGRYVFPGEEPGCRCRWTPVLEFQNQGGE